MRSLAHVFMQTKSTQLTLLNARNKRHDDIINKLFRMQFSIIQIGFDMRYAKPIHDVLSMQNIPLKFSTVEMAAVCVRRLENMAQYHMHTHTHTHVVNATVA